jgi:hypothetical protein
MPFRNFLNSNNPYLKLNESNFISKDILGLVDSDASFKLSELKIDKLFEGLDFEKSQDLCNLIGNNSLSIKNTLVWDKSDTTFAIDILQDQLDYMREKIGDIEREFDKWYEYIIKAHERKEGAEKEKLLAQYTSPSSISSVIPNIERIVQDAKNSGTNFSNERLRQAFIDLHKINIDSILVNLMSDIEGSARNVGLKNLYKEIDSYNMETIESSSATTFPATYITKQLNYQEMYESNDPLSRMAAFFEQVLMLYPFGYYLKRNFSSNYSVITDSPLAISTLKQFVPNLDYSAFENISELLDTIAEVIVTRIYANSPEETNRNIFVPALQATWVGMLTIVALKLINYNVKIEDVIVQKEKEKEILIAKTKEERSRKAFDCFKLLSERGFFSAGSSIYKEGANNMDSESIKNINNFLHSLTFLPDSKVDSNVFDSETTKAVLKLQQINKAKLTDGIIGPETRSIIEKTAQMIAQKYNLS